MRLFISYGHDGNADFVKRITADLRAAGHDPWIDSQQIHKEADWRRALVDALRASDWTLGFLSAHGMRPRYGAAPSAPGQDVSLTASVCREELRFAWHQRGGCVTTVLLEPLDASWSMPPSIGRLQWIDMSDWRREQDPAAPATDWYRGKLAELLHRLRPEAAEAHAREMARLTHWLDPVRQDPEADPRIKGFVGREWLVKRVEAWRQGTDQAPMFWLHGAPGSGKSAFAAWIAATQQCNVVALNLCDWRLSDRRDPRRVILTLAWQIARAVPDARPRLLENLRPLIETTPAGEERVKEANLFDLFDKLITQPLATAFDGGLSTDRLLIVVDGLDEAVAAPAADPKQQAARQTDETLVKILATQGKALPGWVGLLVTSRPERPMSKDFEGLPHLRVDAETAENRADLLTYAQAWLKPILPDEGERARLAEAIADRAEGSFIYLRKLQELHRIQPGLKLDPGRLPVGLDALYGDWFERQFGHLAAPAGYRGEIAPVLELIVAAATPIPTDALKAVLGCPGRIRRHGGGGFALATRLA
jgi:hypothetical protein